MVSLPNPTKSGLGASVLVPFTAPFEEAPEPNENPEVIAPEVLPNANASFLSTGGGVEGVAPNEKGVFGPSVAGFSG